MKEYFPTLFLYLICQMTDILMKKKETKMKIIDMFKEEIIPNLLMIMSEKKEE